MEQAINQFYELKKISAKKPKVCVRCKGKNKEGNANQFTIEHTERFRKLVAKCTADNPCNFHIELHVANIEPLRQLITELDEEIKQERNALIQLRSKATHGLIEVDKAVAQFEKLRDNIEDLTRDYQFYLQIYSDNTKVNIVDIDRQIQLATNPTHILQLQKQKRNLVYPIQYIKHDDKTDSCVVIQRKVVEEQLVVPSAEDIIKTFIA